MMDVVRLILFSLLCLLIDAPVEAAGPETAGLEFFESKVRPVLVEHCFKCHSDKAPKLKGGLRVDSREALLAGGDNGPVLVPGMPEKSKLIEAVTFKNIDLQMPRDGKLPDAVIADLIAWVKMGAPWPGKQKPGTTEKAAFDLEKRKKEHWAWQPIQNAVPPAVHDESWPLAPLDRFVLAKLEEKGIVPAKPAEGHVLLRRLYFDLIGLPPSINELREFEVEFAKKPQEALERVIDRLLASPQFGERWARHWLDLVRYGESRGHEFDPNIPNAWQYRDYVIRAFNSNVPYNQFVMEHVAGDLLPTPRLNPDEGFNESILGSGFWFLGEEVHSPVDIRGDEADRFDNRIDVLTKTFLGLTVSCARCHDHKFDAISTKDYYALYGFMRSGNYRLVRFDSLEHNKRVAGDLAGLRRQFRPTLYKAYAELMKLAVDRSGDYLLAARDVLQASKGMGEINVAAQDRLQKIAADRNLDPKRLAYWTLHVMKAAKSPGDPLHVWARIADGGKVHASLANSSSQVKQTNGPNVIIDYAKSRPEDWMPDGSSFGLGPVRLGEPLFSNDPFRPISRIFDYTAAERDSAFDGLKIAGDAQIDTGALEYMRSGQTIRTPTFPIETGRVFYLVKGTGRVYVSVHGHTLIAGPLHAGLVRAVKAGAAFQWIEHDLKDYKGHRAHLEFTGESSDFAVAMVVQGEAPPRTQPQAGPPMPLADGMSDSALASRYQDLFTRINGLFEKDALREVEDARLADWMIQHPELFGVEEKAIRDVSKSFMAEQARLIAQIKNQSRLAPAMQDGSGEDEKVFIRGSHKAPGELVPRRLLQALAGEKPIGDRKGSGRLELARQMTDPAINPFATRIIVNRIWHHLFGRGIVASTDNFGIMGERPTHPELLDYLATQFVEDGWSMKKMIRRLVLSRSYRMSSQSDETADRLDPENLLLHRMRLRRLEGEAIRDAMLAISGRLDSRMYGPSVPVHLTPFLDGRGKPKSGPIDGDGRRSLYTAVRRNFLSPMMLAFDTPSPFSTVGRRTVSNVPAQALILMNDPFVQQMAELWGKKIGLSGGNDQERIAVMYRSAFARDPTPPELHNCLNFLEAKRKSTKNGANDSGQWIALAHVIWNVKEFIFVE